VRTTFEVSGAALPGIQRFIVGQAAHQATELRPTGALAEEAAAQKRAKEERRMRCTSKIVE